MEKCEFPSEAWSALVVALGSCWMCSCSVCSSCFAVTGVGRLLDWQLVTLFFPTLVYDQISSKIWSGALLLIHLEYVSTSLMCFCNAFVLCRISVWPTVGKSALRWNKPSFWPLWLPEMPFAQKFPCWEWNPGPAWCCVLVFCTVNNGNNNKCQYNNMIIIVKVPLLSERFMNES